MQDESLKLAVLITAFNRVSTTLRCIERVVEASKAIAAGVDIYLVDDNSPDQTGILVKNKFSCVNVIYGSGNLYWGGGINLAWRSAVDENDYNYFLWLNDDVLLTLESLNILLSTARNSKYTLVAGCVISIRTNEVTYGLKSFSGELLTPGMDSKDALYLNGNVVLVSREVFLKLGYLNDRFIHHLGDYDYGLRALKNSIELKLTPKSIGTCESNEVILNRSRLKGVTLLRRLRRLYSPLGSNPFAMFTYKSMHFGLLSAIKTFVYQHVINLLPDALYTYISRKK